jgi:nicotinamide-nucleotide amidase
MKCSIISIGTELSLGLITDSNSRFIAGKLSELGIECNYMFTVPDSVQEIMNVLKSAMTYSDIIILSGGLGPTDDDMTRTAVGEALGLKLVRDKKLDTTSLKFLRHRRTKDIDKRLLRQSFVPEGSFPIIPRIGSASGFRIDLGKNKYIFSIPGVPREMESMFVEDIMPFLLDLTDSKDNQNRGPIIRKSTLLTTDMISARQRSRKR